MKPTFLLVLLAAVVTAASTCNALKLSVLQAVLLATQASALSLDLVLCRYMENSDAVVAFATRAQQELPSIIERKHVFLIQHEDPRNATVAWPSSWTIIQTPNWGHEEHCHLTYLVHHRHALSDFVWFSHALPDKYMNDKLWKRLPLMTERTGLIGLAPFGRCDCDASNCGQRSRLVRAREIYVMAMKQFCFGSWDTPFNGEFVVSRKWILQHPISFYSYLLDVASSKILWDDNLFVEAPHRPSKESFFGHVM